MNKTKLLIVCIGLFFHLTGKLLAQDYFPESKHWIQKAEQLKPKLKETVVRPVSIVELVKNEAAFQGWEMKTVADAETVYNGSFKKVQSVILDFGDHYTGYFSFDLETIWRTSDAPLRFKLTFGEVPAELAVPFEPYDGELSRAWLQDEIVTIMKTPTTFKLDRRVSFRYLKIDLLASSQYFDFKINDIRLNAVTSATSEIASLPESVSEEIKEIDRVSVNTLKECMQTVYEDGPKRDRRLWVGDVYLQALANDFSFKNHQLTKRCLYLMAGLCDSEGYILGTFFETPEPHAQAGQRLLDYSLLFNVALNEYVKTTDDTETANELWPVVKRQLTLVNDYVDSNGLVDYDKLIKSWGLFFDWREGLNKNTPIQGLMIFALNETYELAIILGRTSELAYIPGLIDKMKRASIDNMYNKKKGLFESGNDHQISYASQIWMILGGVLNKAQSQEALNSVMNMSEAVSPSGPYMYHYFIQALINSNMNDKAKGLLVNYWGGMVEKGADTFWELYDPNDDFLSPYHFYPINSYCHAWSCTPVYFIRKYPEVFQIK